MLDEALTVIRRLWTEESVTFSGRFFTLRDALCEPKPIQRPHPPIVIGGSQPKMLRVIARHADEWNMPSHEGPSKWAEVNGRLHEACQEVGRGSVGGQAIGEAIPASDKPGQVEEQLAAVRTTRALVASTVLSFYQPPTEELLNGWVRGALPTASRPVRCVSTWSMARFDGLSAHRLEPDVGLRSRAVPACGYRQQVVDGDHQRRHDERRDVVTAGRAFHHRALTQLSSTKVIDAPPVVSF